MPYYSSIPRRNKQKRSKKKILVFAFLFILLLTIAGWWLLVMRSSDQPEQQTTQDTKTQTTKQQSNAQTPSEPTFDKTEYSLTDPASPWVIVNKQRPLEPLQYVPTDLGVPNVPLKYEAGAMETELRKEAVQALEEMFASAETDGLPLIFVSGYRSYSYQDNLFNYYVSTQGEATALQQSARPGHSEHQTGWAADVGALNRQCEIEECFGDTSEGEWVAANAHRFGFVIRYPKGLTDTTGYDYEPWHLRYVGVELAAEIKRAGTQTLEEFFDLPAAPEY